MSFVALWLFCVHTEERRSIIRYFRRVLGYGPLRAVYMAIRNHLLFGMMIVDRFAVYARGGDTIKFDLDLENNDFMNLCRQEKGIVIASAHLGNFEIGGYVLRQNLKKIHIFSYGGEEASLQEKRKTTFDGSDIVMEYASDDVSNLLRIKNILDGGDVVAMLCDRFISGEKRHEVTFMGRPAALLDGMFRIAEKLNVPVVSFFVVRTGYMKYKAYVRELCSDPDIRYSRGEKTEAFLNGYISDMEKVIFEYPEQWFNYFDFWNYAD